MTVLKEDLSKKDLIEVLDLLDLCIRYQCLDDQREIALSISNLLMVSNVAFSIGKLDKEERLLSEEVRILDMSLYQPHDKEHLYVSSDPCIRQYLQEFSIQEWLDEFDKVKNGVQSNFMVENVLSKSVGYVIVGVLDLRRRQAALFSFIGKDVLFEKRQKEIIKHITPYLYEAFNRVSSNLLDVNSKLTVREKEALRWAVVGKTNWEISRILNVSESAIKHHFKNIYVKLSASNRAHVVAIAMEQKFF